MGIISGYPVGAKIAANFRNNNMCSKEECERLLSFTNNSGPLFIIGTVGISMFHNFNIGLLLFITHILASFTVGFLFRFWKYSDNSIKQIYNLNNSPTNSVNLCNLGEVLSESINSSISTVLMIGGFIVLFSTLISILNSSGITKIVFICLSPFFDAIHIDTSFINGLFTGIFEITNGINYISQIYSKNAVNIIFTAFLLGFGGISVMLQVLSIVSKTDLSFKPYIIGKILHGILAAFYTSIFTNFLSNFRNLQ